MATRWYLSKQAHTTINPGILGTWNNTGPNSLLNLESTRAANDTSFTGYGLSGLTSTNSTLMRTFISPGMNAGVVFGTTTTYTINVKCREETNIANLVLRAYVHIVSEDGLTNRNFSAFEQDGYEFTYSTSTYYSRELSYSPSSGSYTTVAGDRLVVEVGWQKTASSTSSEGWMMFGNADATNDLIGDDDTGSDNPWFECSLTIGTGTGGATPPSTVEDFSTQGFITGVLDEAL